MAMIRKCKKRKFDETKMFYSDSLWWEFRHILNFKLIVYVSIFKSWILMLWLHLSQGLNVLTVTVTRPCIPVYTYFTNEYWQDWGFFFLCQMLYIKVKFVSQVVLLQYPMYGYEYWYTHNEGQCQYKYALYLHSNRFFVIKCAESLSQKQNTRLICKVISGHRNSHSWWTASAVPLI